MAKKVSKKRKAPAKKRPTNWWLIGGFVAVGVVGLFALLFLSLQNDGVTVAQTTPTPNLLLTNYCEANEDNCVMKGSADASVTLIEISDYGCTHCRTFYRETEPLIDERYVESGEIRYIVVPYSLRPETVLAANGGLCSAEQERFFEYSTAMFAQYDQPDARQPEGVLRAAEVAGVDTEQFSQCLDENRYNDVLQNNIAAVSAAGISSTPNFFVNGQLVPGAQPFAAFQQLIDTLLGA